MDQDAVQLECDRLARAIVESALRRHVKVSTAESCTAGLVASSIADVPGASGVLLGGAVTYRDEVKRGVLGVPASTLELHTAVSGQAACAMAVGSRRLFGSDIAVSITGYAGPGGGTPDDPVGTVYIGIDQAGGTTARRFAFEGDRRSVRMQAVLAALDLVLAALGEHGVFGE